MDSPSHPRVSVIIVNWNTVDSLCQCVRSVELNGKNGEYQVIVVDNASRDGSAEAMREQFPWVHLVANTVNKGFSGGVNDGLAAATGELLVVLNPDIQVPPGGIDTMDDVLLHHPELGAVSPLLVNEKGEIQSGYFRRRPSVMQVFLFYTKVESLARRSTRLVKKYLEGEWQIDEDGLARVEQLPGAFIVAKKSTFDNVGGFDEAFPLFFEDVDWSTRVRNAGLALVLVPAVRAQHEGGRSFSRERGWVSPLFRGSLLLYFKKHGSLLEWLTVDAALFVNSILALVKNSIETAIVSGERKEAARISRRQHMEYLRYRMTRLRTDARKELPS